MKTQSVTPKWTELAVGTAVTVPGASRATLTGDWRSQRPIWNHEQCVRCGVCVIFCPEGCVSFSILSATSQKLPQADLNYCKGCGICAQECPTSCIHMQNEEE